MRWDQASIGRCIHCRRGWTKRDLVLAIVYGPSTFLRSVYLLVLACNWISTIPWPSRWMLLMILGAVISSLDRQSQGAYVCTFSCSVHTCVYVCVVYTCACLSMRVRVEEHMCTSVYQKSGQPDNILSRPDSLCIAHMWNKLCMLPSMSFCVTVYRHMCKHAHLSKKWWKPVDTKPLHLQGSRLT